VTLTLETRILPDPDGHGAALALAGDWLVVAVGDGTHAGLGEASHSRDDAACLARVRVLFDAHVKDLAPTLEGIRALESGPFSSATDFVTATGLFTQWVERPKYKDTTDKWAREAKAKVLFPSGIPVDASKAVA